MHHDTDILHCTVQILLRKKHHSEYLSVLGNALRKFYPEGGTPLLQRGLGLKRLFLSHPDQFILTEGDDGTCIVQLARAEDCVQDSDFVGYVDYDQLEKKIVEFILDHERSSDDPMSLPILGEYCRHVLKTPMKGRLTRFLSDRKDIFVVPDTGRQHVLLTEGACKTVGIDCRSKLPKLPDTIPEFHGCPTEWDTLDSIAKEVYGLLSMSEGILSVEELEYRIRRNKLKDKDRDVQDRGDWHVGSTVYKYPHVFHRLNQHIALVERINPSTKDSVLPKEDDFPPLGS